MARKKVGRKRGQTKSRLRLKRWAKMGEKAEVRQLLLDLKLKFRLNFQWLSEVLGCGQHTLYNVVNRETNSLTDAQKEHLKKIHRQLMQLDLQPDGEKTEEKIERGNDQNDQI